MNDEGWYKAKEMAPYILESLHRAEIKKDQISFMRAWGSDCGGRHFSQRPRGLAQRMMKKLNKENR